MPTALCTESEAHGDLVPAGLDECEKTPRQLLTAPKEKLLE